MKETAYGTFGPMLEVAESYFRRGYDPNDCILYRSVTGLYAENVCFTGMEQVIGEEDVYVENAKMIQCSEFAMAVCSGIPYGSSRYAGNRANGHLWWGFGTDGSVRVDYSKRLPGYLDEEDYLTAAEFAEYCHLKGWLIPFDPRRNRLQPGDIVFFERKQNSQYSEVFRNVGHVAIVLDRDDEGFTCIESMPTRRRRFDNGLTSLIEKRRAYSEEIPAYTSRLPITPSGYRVERIADLPEKRTGTFASEAEMARLSFEEPLPVGFYSLNWTEDGDGKSFVRVTGVNAKGEAVLTDREILRATGRRHFTFFADMPLSSVCICARAGSRYEIGELTLHKGYYV